MKSENDCENGKEWVAYVQDTVSEWLGSAELYIDVPFTSNLHHLQLSTERPAGHTDRRHCAYPGSISSGM